MAISTYSELKSAIADWLNRDDLTSVIPSFIELAEAELTRNLRHRKMIARADATINSEYTQTPTDWFQTQTLILETDPVTTLEYLTPEALNAKRAESTANGKPLFYTMIGTEIQVYPVPSGDHTAEMVYYSKIPSLSDSETTNWLLTLAPDIYLYGSLMQSAPYLQDDNRLSVWNALYQKKIEDIYISDQRTTGQTSVVMRAAVLG
tara:strand:+ start:1870 stop:2487 length:618 start_codon:yes stop_codon:yes gene_type:complete